LLLLGLTIVTGLVDAVSYLRLEHVFVANMTGNVVFLGFATGGAPGFSIGMSIAAIASFLAGALGGGRLAASASGHRGRFIALTSYAQIALLGTALVVSQTFFATSPGVPAYALVILLAVAMGLQNATVRRLGVPDLTTTVLTLTLTGLAADSNLAGGTNPNVRRRLLGTGAMFLGAAVGALLILRVGISAALAVAFVLLAVNAVAGYRLSSSTAAWTAAK
jgi:uncharacterized membrane protein YoaK (UPF0700 family)